MSPKFERNFYLVNAWLLIEAPKSFIPNASANNVELPTKGEHGMGKITENDGIFLVRV